MAGIYEVELSDGRIVELESDNEPDEQSILAALASGQQQSEPAPFSLDYAPAPIPRSGLERAAMDEASLGPLRQSIAPPPTREQQVMEETWETLSPGERALSDISRLGRGAVSGVGKGIEGVGTFEELTNPPPPMGSVDARQAEMRAMMANARSPEMRESLRSQFGELEPQRAAESPEARLAANPLVQQGRSITAGGERAFPTIQPESVDRPLGAVLEGVGSSAPILLAGVVTGGAGVIPAAAAMEFQDAFDREIARQQREGEKPDYTKGLYKASGYAAVSSGIEQRLGVGRLIKNAGKRFGAEAERELARSLASQSPREAIKDFTARRLKDIGPNALDEGLQRLSQDMIVEGKPEWGAIFQEAAIGGVSGPLTGAVLDAPGTAVQMLPRGESALQGAPLDIPIADRIKAIDDSLAEFEKKLGPRDTFNKETGKGETVRFIDPRERELLNLRGDLERQQAREPQPATETSGTTEQKVDDYDRYAELGKEASSATPERQAEIFKEMETIKRRHAEMPPRKPSERSEPFVLNKSPDVSELDQTVDAPAISKLTSTPVPEGLGMESALVSGASTQTAEQAMLSELSRSSDPARVIQRWGKKLASLKKENDAAFAAAAKAKDGAALNRLNGPRLAQQLLNEGLKLISLHGKTLGATDQLVAEANKFYQPPAAEPEIVGTLTPRTPNENTQEKEAPVLAPVESRIDRAPLSEDVYEMDDADLADLLESKYGQRQSTGTDLEAGRSGTYVFPTYDAFKSWMDARYGERDLEGMRLAFAEADTPTKIRYLKEHKAADAHKKAWVTSLATGAAIPTTDPPVTRTTPRPGPSGAPAPGPTPTGQRPPARPAGPPPAPRAPTSHRKFDIMALVQLFRQFSKFPVVNERLMRAYGRFVPGTKAVELKARLLWDTALAERVLGHEIGHFIDLALNVSGLGKKFGEKLKPLYDFRTRMFEEKALRNEARSLSRSWRGPFLNGDRYRDSSNELFADFMSAMFNNPEWVNQQFPLLFDAFQDLRDAKPQFKNAYREIETWLQGGTMAAEFINQQRAAVEKTLDELEKPKKPSKASFWDRLKFGTMSLWGRAYQKEGKPRNLGDSIADELEYNKTWAAKENALMADDFARDVAPELEKVSNDPIKARADLTAYSQAVRTIGERRAAGVWIEQHPQEARKLLEELLKLDPTLHAKWSSALSSAPNSGLYDLSGAILREIHDRGDKFVSKISNAIDNLNLGVEGDAVMVAFNVRGKLLNPGGLTPDNAQKVIDTLRDSMPPGNFTALETAARNLRELMFKVQSKMHDEGLISDQMWKELILPNRDNYLPYAVLDYFDGNVRAGVMPQKGTAKDVADIAAATQLKIAASNVWRQKQRQVQLLRDAYQKGGVTIPVGEKLKRSSDIDRIKNKNKNDDVSRAVLFQDGSPHLVEFPGDPGKLLEAAMDNPAFYEHIGWITEASDATHRVMQLYTQFSVPFLFWRNPIRGARTAALKTGFYRVGKQMTPAQLAQNAKLAKNYADAAFGGVMLPEIRDLVDRQILLPPRLSQAMVRDSASLRQMLASHMVLANQVRNANVGKPSWWKGGEIGRQGVILSEKVFTGYEAFEKIYNYYAALDRGLSPEKAGAIARRGGIPKPGVGGKWSLAMEVWFPWTRVHLQGLRSTFDVAKDPELGKGFAARFAITEALPRIAKVAIATGLVGGLLKWALRDDEDENDGVMAEFFRRVSPYKMALDDTIPLYFYDPRTGKVHYPWEFKAGKDVPKHFEAVSFRIPASEEGRLWGTLLYQLMISAPGAYERIGQPGKGFVENVGSWAVNYLGPGLSPVLETASNLKDMILLGKNPEDPYRGQPAANDQLFEAGGVDRAQAIAGYVLNQLGSPGELVGVIAANFGILDSRALKSMSRRLPTDYKTWNDKLPFLKTAIAHDNYGQYRGEKIDQIEEDQLRAKARLVMPPEARSLYDFYYRQINRKGKLTERELEQFEVTSEFVNGVWGTLTIDGEPNPDSFYSKAAHAVGKDGSRQAKETFTRDLNAAASPYIAEFLRLNQP